MPLGQPQQLIKWSLPAFAILLGLLWYKRRRGDLRVDPGGSPERRTFTATSTADNRPRYSLDSSATIAVGLAAAAAAAVEEEKPSPSSPRSDSPQSDVPSPSGSFSSPQRKVSESMDIPNRKPVCPPSSLLSCPSWLETPDSSPDEEVVVLGSNPAKRAFDLLAMGGKKLSADAARNSIEEEDDQQQQQEQQQMPCKVIIANGDNHRHSSSSSSSKSQVQQSSPSPSKQETQEDKEEQQQTTVPERPAEEKDSSLQRQTSDDNKKGSRAPSERDSANQSPVSGVHDGSVADEASSEGSNDSGKGGSIKDMRGASPKEDRSLYDFLIPIKLVGRLIGKGGRFLQHLRNNADVNIMIKRHPNDRDYKICSIDGTNESIAIALDMIRQYFPEKNHPTMTLQLYTYDDVTDQVPLLPELTHLSLVEGVNNDVIVSQIIAPNHFFVQLPTHPSFPSLKILDQALTVAYDSVQSPPVPDQLKEGMIVVAKWYEKWVRVYVETPDPKGEETICRLVDHGGYKAFRHADMRKIRFDFLNLPFQAIEVFLANVQPKNGEWSKKAYEVVAQICSGIVGQAQIVGYTDYSTFINLYFSFHKHGVISLADELIARDLAEPVPLADPSVLLTSEEVQVTE